MPRSVVILTDPSSGISHKYEGVALEHLMSTPAPSLESGSLEISYGGYQKMTISGSTIDSASKPLVAYTLDGKRLTGYVPYSLIVQKRAGTEFTQPLPDVDLIRVQFSPH